MSLMEKGDSEAQPTCGDNFQFKNTLKKYFKFCFDPLPRSCEKIQKEPNIFSQISITFLDYSYFFFQIKTTVIILNNFLEALCFLYKNFK